jgi:hypothetical protein
MTYDGTSTDLQTFRTHELFDSSRSKPSDAKQDVRGSNASPQQILDVTVQSSTVDLFHSLGVSVAPLPRARSEPKPREHFDVVGIVSFATTHGNGNLMVSMAPAVYGLLAPPIAGSHAINDALREITNQLVGRIKNRLIHFQVTLRVGLPSATRKQFVTQSRSVTGPIEHYVFRTLRGEIVVTISGTIHDESMSYTNRVRVAKEGDLIIF